MKTKDASIKMIYIIVLFSLFAWLLPSKRNVQILLLFLYVVLVSLILGLRTIDSGTDTVYYAIYYKQVLISGDDNGRFEYLFYLLTKLLTIFNSVTFYIYALTTIQLVAIAFVAIVVKLRMPVLLLSVYLSFLPGLDMLTNGVRGGISLSLGLLVVVFYNESAKARLAGSFIPIFIHYSYIFVVFSDYLSKYVKLKKIHILNYVGVVFLLVASIIDTSFISDFFETLRGSDEGLVAKFLRYMINRDSILSTSVELYFVFVSIVLSMLLMHLVKEQGKEISNLSLNLYRISSCLFFTYALFQFSAFSFRFMFIAYVFQVCSIVCMLEYYSERSRHYLILMLVLFVSTVVTYNTNSFTNYRSIDIW